MRMAAHARYEVSSIPSVARAVRELERKALWLGMRQDLVAALKVMIEKLQKDPLKWGDSEYDFNKPKSHIYHGLCDPVFVQYAVVEAERKVIIMLIKPLPSSPL